MKINVLLSIILKNKKKLITTHSKKKIECNLSIQ